MPGRNQAGGAEETFGAVQPPHAISVYQRAPTLLAGMPGSQGAVRVWSAASWRIWVRSLAWGIPDLLLVFLFFFLQGVGWLPLTALCLMFGSVCWSGLSIALHWPRSVTTDDSGISIATWGRGLAWRWGEIQSLERRTTALFGPYLSVEASGEPVVIDLAGYSRGDQERLFHLIRTKAELLPDPHRPSLHLSEEVMPALPSSPLSGA